MICCSFSEQAASLLSKCFVSFSCSVISGKNSVSAEIPSRWITSDRTSKEGLTSPDSMFWICWSPRWHWSASSCWVSPLPVLAVSIRSPKYKSSLLGSFFGFCDLCILHHLNYILSCVNLVSYPLIKCIDMLVSCVINQAPCMKPLKKRLHA